MVRCNAAETRRVQYLSGLLQLSYAGVYREGLIALEEREAQKEALLFDKRPPPAPAPPRKLR